MENSEKLAFPQQESSSDRIEHGFVRTVEELAKPVPTGGQERVDYEDAVVATFMNTVLEPAVRYEWEGPPLEMFHFQDGKAVMFWEKGEKGYGAEVRMDNDGKALKVNLYGGTGGNQTLEHLTPQQAYEVIDAFVKRQMLESK